MNDETKRDKNRREAPNVAEIVDNAKKSVEKVFGKSGRRYGLLVKVTAAEDYVTGVKFGEFPEEKEDDQ
jgi:hypothetical protein